MRNLQQGLALVLALSTVAAAQDPGRGGRGRRGNPGGRDSLNAVVGQAIDRAIRTQLQATDDQLAKMRQIEQRFRPRRVEIDREEQQTRRELRQAMLDTANVNQALIGQLLDKMVAFPGRRAALMVDEDKALAEVLSPLQRAKFHAIQEQIRRRVDQGRGGPPPGRGRPPQGIH